MPLIAVLFFFTVPRREALVCEREACHLEVSQGLRTRVVPVRDVRVEDDADTKQPGLVIETTVNIERFALGETVPRTFEEYERIKRGEERAALEVELLGSRWWTILGVLAALEIALVLFFALKRRPSTE